MKVNAKVLKDENLEKEEGQGLGSPTSYLSYLHSIKYMNINRNLYMQLNFERLLKEIR